MKKKSLFTRLFFSSSALLTLFGLALVLIIEQGSFNWPAFCVITFIFVALLLALFRWQLAPLTQSLTALDNGINALKDNDFSLTIHNKEYLEVANVINIYNELTTVLRNERMDIFQRELLLDTVIQSTPVSLILTTNSGAIVYSNLAAKKLLKQQKNINGANFYTLNENLAPALKKAALEKTNGLVTDIIDEQSIIYNVNCRQFMLNGREHSLYLFKNMTSEIAQKETDLWKQIIRLISHELNNSLAPIASLTRSAQKIIEKPEHLHMLHDVLETIGNRANHLHEFISQYAKFARLPKPELINVDLSRFLSQLATITDVTCNFQVHSKNASFDAGQIEQVIINLVKNALESGSDKKDVGVDITQQANLLTVSIFDRGDGMTDAQMQQALLPFFTTKPTGSGVGLALCNEIVSNHGGKLRLSNREHGGLCVSFNLSLKE